MFQEVNWRAWKNFLHFRKINLLPSSLKTPVFFRKPFWVFITASLDVFTSLCFHFLFMCFYWWLHLFTSLFRHCCSCYDECYRFEREFFTLRRFVPYTSSCFYQAFPGVSECFRLPSIQNIDPSVNLTHLFVWITQSSVTI